MKDYILLAKPGIILGNAVTAISGFFLASKGSINAALLIAMLVGLSCIIASACVFNNYFDAHADQKMTRTQNRPLVKKTILPAHALIFATILFFLGSLVLLFFTTWLALAASLCGFFVYVALYTPLKYRTIHATAIGSVAGAMPPVVGYLALKPDFDLALILLFLTVALWQMPHFYAIAIYRLEDYRAAEIPVLPLMRGMYVTKLHMFVTIICFSCSMLSLTFLGYTGYAYGAIMALLGAYWLWLSAQGFSRSDNQSWARGMFSYSLVIVMAFSFMIAIDTLS